MKKNQKLLIFLVLYKRTKFKEGDSKYLGDFDLMFQKYSKTNGKGNRKKYQYLIPNW